MNDLSSLRPLEDDDSRGFFAHVVFLCLNSLKHRTQFVSMIVGVINTKSSVITSESAKLLNRKPNKGILDKNGTAFLFSVEVLS